MSVFWSERCRMLTPYVPGEQPRARRFIKLNTNENAYPPSPKVQEAVGKETENLRLYPPSDGDALREALAAFRNVPADWTFVGNGSDEVLSFAFAAFTGPEKRVYFPAVTYSFYPVYADFYQTPYRTIPMGRDLTIQVDSYPTDGAVIFANPNAPTSRALPLSDIKRLAERLFMQQQLLIIDEAYADFGAESATSLFNELPNLLVVGTLSKSHGLAGLRVGYAMGQPHLIEGLKRVKDSFNSYPLDRLALAGATAAVQDAEYFEKTRNAIVATRERVAAKLTEMGYIVLPSAANFLFARFPGRSGETLQKLLREKGILVRHFDQPETADYLRVTIGTDEDMDEVLRAMEEI